MAGPTTAADYLEEIRLLEMAEAAKEASDNEPDFETAGGLIPKGEGGVRDVSDPTRLIRIYERQTGEPRDVPAWTLEGKNSILRRRTDDGGRIYTDRPGTGDWAPGEIPCLLNEAHPRRALYRKMGLLHNCPAAHLGSVYDQQQHMKNRHRREWATIVETEATARDEEDREFRQLQTLVMQQTLAAQGGAATAVAPAKPIEKMTKTELQTLAREHDVVVEPDATNAQIREALAAAGVKDED